MVQVSAESQHILRVHDTGTLKTIIAPYRKTEAPTRTVTSQACGTQIVQGAETACFDDVNATYSNGKQSILTIYDDSAQAAFASQPREAHRKLRANPAQSPGPSME